MHKVNNLHKITKVTWNGATTIVLGLISFKFCLPFMRIFRSSSQLLRMPRTVLNVISTYVVVVWWFILPIVIPPKPRLGFKLVVAISTQTLSGWHVFSWLKRTSTNTWVHAAPKNCYPGGNKFIFLTILRNNINS